MRSAIVAIGARCRVCCPAQDALRRLVVVGLLLGGANANAALSDAHRDAGGDAHQDAVQALADVHAAIDDLNAAVPSAGASPDDFMHATRRAINDLVGPRDARYRTPEGHGGDMIGALGHLRRLVAHDGIAPWVTPIAAARDRIRAAVTRLQEACAADPGEPYWHDVAAALAELEAAVGHASELGAAGGISGALATTVLGVPAGARTVSACDVPREFPSYGVAAGYLVFVALPAQQGEVRLANDLGVTLLVPSEDHLIAYTAAETLRPALCGSVRDSSASPVRGESVVAVAR